MENQQPESMASPTPGALPATAAGPDETTRPADPEAWPGIDGVYLWVGASTVALRCRRHRDFDEVHAYGTAHEVPAGWIAGVLTRHLNQHTSEPAPPAAVTFPKLVEFSHKITAHCRWAITANDSEPNDEWPLDERLAVALVLASYDYLADMLPLAYTRQGAEEQLAATMEILPGDVRVLIGQLRKEVKPPRVPPEPPGVLLHKNWDAGR